MELSRHRRGICALATAFLVVSSTTSAQDTPPPIPERYQVIDLSPYTAIGINDNGDVLLGDLLFEVNRTDNPGTRCLLYTSPSPRDLSTSRMPSSA